MNDAVCVCCGHGVPADGWLCRTCLDSGETWDDTPATPMEIAWARRVREDAIEALGPNTIDLQDALVAYDRETSP